MLFFPTPDQSFHRYDVQRSYEWNYANAPPLPRDYVVAQPDREWNLCGVKVNSPIAIAAGPLLNGRWLLHYAALGYDVLTYKTVRSRLRACYPLPNLQPVEAVELARSPDAPLKVADQMDGSWAVSFGMPSTSPDLWRFDVEETRRLLPQPKKLSVSVVATPEADWLIDQVAEDYARCARWAVESGADFVELNFSCPNVASCDGQLYQNAEDARIVAQQVRGSIGDTPILLKIGHVTSPADAMSLVRAVSGIANGLVMINCIAAAIESDTEALFGGMRRGIAGRAIQQAVLRQVDLFQRAVTAENANLEIVAVGGIASIDDVEAGLNAGAVGVQVATAAML